jgi:Cu(I)/Ag(I) efflux system protein CusF
MNHLSKLILCAALGVSGAASAQADHAHHASTPAASVAQAGMSEGEIRKVDKETGKLTIKHGELKNIGMGAMTMAFKVREPAMLDQVKTGDKVRFTVEKVAGTLTVTAIEAAK